MHTRITDSLQGDSTNTCTLHGGEARVSHVQPHSSRAAVGVLFACHTLLGIKLHTASCQVA
jgi:hypothetical protein